MKHTPLYETHKQLGGKMVDFAGWELPVDYGSIVREHEAVRERVGIFDVSHMGELFFQGSDTRAALSWLISNIVPKVESKRAVYSGLLNEEGCFIDDVIAGMLGEAAGFMVVNAANEAKDYDWIHKKLTERSETLGWDVMVTNSSADYGLLAVQGKKAMGVLEQVFPNFTEMKPFSIVETTFKDVPIVLTFTGYTGEAGVELMVPNDQVVALFNAFTELGVEPCGLGARDSLRLEKGYSLYGHELNETINAWEAGLGWTVKLKKEAFIGKECLAVLHEDLEHRVKRKLVGLLIEGSVPIRTGAEIVSAADKSVTIGSVTSGSWSPTLKKPIALGYVKRDYALETVAVRTRGRMIKAQVTERTFV